MIYTEKQKIKFVDEICKRVSKGQSLVKVLETDKSLPQHTIFYEWLLFNKNFAEKYARACVLRAEIEYENVLTIADNITTDAKPDYFVDENNVLKVDHENINRSRLRVDTRKWWLSKMVPKVYGDKVHLNIEGHAVNPQGFDISLLQPDTLALIERDLLSNNNKTLTGSLNNKDIQEVDDLNNPI
ncbi:MAG: hypothetical protein PF487_13115 [Bacteroidales bacterium]|jgi:hypothetical protein|nr:hypothetical protein [Bacteroidales bacterium]